MDLMSQVSGFMYDQQESKAKIDIDISNVDRDFYQPESSQLDYLYN